MPIDFKGRAVPRRALALSLGALTIPMVGALRFSEGLGEVSALLWLLVLVPVFTLAYYRVWRGVAIALAVGLGVLAGTATLAWLLGLAVPDLLPGVVVANVVITAGIGGLAQALHRDRAEVEDMAFTDPLTLLPNRRHARLFLENEFAAAERGRRLSVVLFDLDSFKDFNDRHGHAAGDAALEVFGGLLERTTRRMDLSARFGGEEFISILTSTDTEGAIIFADRIRAALEEMEVLPGVGLTVSGGVASFRSGIATADELLAEADKALYQAKADGRNCVRLFGRALVDGPGAEEGTQAWNERSSLDGAPSKAKPLTLLPHQITGFGEGRRILLVEDDHQVRSLVLAYLEAEGFETRIAVDVTTGIAALEEDFDAVITDLRLPGLSGTDLVRAAKSRWPRTQLLVMTGLHDATVAAEALSAGADGYLFKPFSMPDLRRHLVDALNRRDRLTGSGGELDNAASERAAASRSAVLEGVGALIRAAEAREPSKRHHGDRVGRFAARIAAVVDPERRIDRAALELGCRLHDVGEIGLSDRLLNKDGALEPHERTLMERHTTIGRTVLEPLLDDELALGVVTWHHERWDGAGYPDGLRGGAIPLAARIVSLSDALDAMTSDRPYRPAHSWDVAVDEIHAGTGASYDPEVVMAFDACLADLERIYHEARNHA